MLNTVSYTCRRAGWELMLVVTNPLSSLQILLRDLFGSPAEEREVKEVICKTPEGRSTQSYNTYELAAKFLSPSLLPELLRPVKEVNSPCTLHGLHLHICFFLGVMILLGLIQRRYFGLNCTWYICLYRLLKVSPVPKWQLL